MNCTHSMEAAGPSKNPLGRGLGWKCGSSGQAIGMPDQQCWPGLFAAAQQGEGGCITGRHCCSVIAVAFAVCAAPVDLWLGQLWAERRCKIAALLLPNCFLQIPCFWTVLLKNKVGQQRRHGVPDSQMELFEWWWDEFVAYVSSVKVLLVDFKQWALLMLCLLRHL